MSRSSAQVFVMSDIRWRSRWRLSARCGLLSESEFAFAHSVRAWVRHSARDMRRGADSTRWEAAPQAQAQPAAPLQQATAEELIQQLAPAQSPTRSMRNIAPVQRQIDLVVSFDFDSDRLQPDSKPLLESLAHAINSERLQGLRFMVEGHTDAKGSARYNELLSARRAQSVVQFLRSQGVLPQRLEAQGRGFQDLLNKDQPEAAENRRVRIVTLAQ